MDILSSIPTWVFIAVAVVLVLAFLFIAGGVICILLFIVLPIVIIASVVRSASRKAHEVVQRVSPLPIPKLPL